MGRYQQGHIYEAFNAFHVRHYVTEMVNGKPTRVQRSKKLCDKDDKHHSRTCKAVRQKCDDFMREINAQAPGQISQEITVAEFWEQTYSISQRKRKRIEEVFGWMKTVGLLRKLRHRGLERVG
jgi:hypothetical protein